MDGIVRGPSAVSPSGARKKRRVGRKGVTLWIVFAIFCVYSLTLVFPFLWLTLNSLRDKVDFFYNPLSLPTKVIFKNYVQIFSDYNIGAMFINSIVLSVSGTAVSVLSGAMGAYVVSKYSFKLKNFIYGLAIALMIIPTGGSAAALYRFMFDTRLDNHFGVILLYGGGFGFNFFLLYGFFKSISWSYAEAAQIDGASNFKVFILIMLPQAAPALLAVGIIVFIGLWNDYYTPYMFLRGHETLAVGIQKLSDTITNAENAYNFPAVFAAIFVATLPVIVVFACFQKTIIQNTVAGGLKG
ncbi:sugar ABC transporter permease [Clostridia bacterium]|nr:sugar ABC transporter permease [Clostridia bacterium]